MFHFDLEEMIRAIGYLGLFGIIFAETGLLFGFFLPGDSLLFTAGLLASEGYLNIYLLIIILIFGAVIGDSVGYSIGKKLGPKVFTKEKSLLFNKNHVTKAKIFFDKHGPKTIILARFVPIVRTFAPTLAGAGGMHYIKFITYNIFGGLLWVLVMTLLGYFLGMTIDNIDKYVLPIIGGIILLSLMPYIKELISNPEVRSHIKSFVVRSKR